MRIKNLNMLVVFRFLIIFLFVMNLFTLALAQNGPIIHIDPITHTFPTAFEGEALSNDFVVSNRGSADLEIKDVTHQ
jgi:hypothetical protein